MPQKEFTAEMSPAVLKLMVQGVVSVETEASALDVARIMKHDGIRNVFVLKDGKPVGVVRDIDIINNVVALHLDPETIKARQIMFTPPPIVSPRAGLGEIAGLMARKGVRRVLVADKNKIYGTITAGDLVGLVSTIPPSSLKEVYKKLQREV